MQPVALFMHIFHPEAHGGILPAINFRAVKSPLLLKNWPGIKEIIHEEQELIDFILFKYPLRTCSQITQDESK